MPNRAGTPLATSVRLVEHLFVEDVRSGHESCNTWNGAGSELPFRNISARSGVERNRGSAGHRPLHLAGKGSRCPTGGQVPGNQPTEPLDHRPGHAIIPCLSWRAHDRPARRPATVAISNMVLWLRASSSNGCKERLAKRRRPHHLWPIRNTSPEIGDHGITTLRGCFCFA